MLKRAFFLQLILLAVTALVVAQPKPEDYTPLTPSGEIPKDMLIKSSKKYEVERSTINKSDSKKDRKSMESFYLSTNFEIDKMLLSGLVSFNDPITIYLNKIVDVLLKDEPALRKQVRVYTMKSTEVNAFATNQGIIFVNLGLLAKVKSEAELAFILAHEITHVEKKHSLNKYLKVQQIKRDKNVYKDLTLDDKLATVNHYSRELETEADEAGLARYLKAGYSLEALNGAFDLLAYSHRPFSEEDVDFSWLASETFKFPEEFYRTQINKVKPLEDKEEDDDDDNDEEESTHPSIEKRRANILAKSKDAGTDGRKATWVSEADFNAIREFSQFEVCRLHLLRQRYDLAIYEAQVLLKQYPDNLYLKKLKLKAIAAMAYFTNEGISIGDWEDYVNEDLQGNVQKSYHFFLSMAVDGDYIATVANRYGWQLRNQHPEDKEILALSDSLMHLVFYEREIDPEFYSMTARTQTEIDSILREYDFAKNPEKRKEWELAQQGAASQDSSIAVVDTSTTKPDEVAEEEVTIEEEEEEMEVAATTVDEAKRKGIKLTGYQKYQLKNKDKYRIKGVAQDGTMVYESEDNTTNTTTTADSSNQEDSSTELEVVATTAEEAKKKGIKLTGYQKYQLKYKTKFNIKGVTKDGTVVYNNSEWEYEEGEEDDSSVTYEEEDLGIIDTAAIAMDSTVMDSIAEEQVYYHEFIEPLDVEFHKYAYVDFANDGAFMKKAKSIYKQKQSDDEYVMSKDERKDKQKESELNYKRGYAKNIKKVVIVNPQYRKINLVNTDKDQYLTSEKNQKKFSNLLKSSAEASDIQYQIIDNKDLKNKEVATFNDIAFLNEWLDERLELGTDVPFSSLELSEREAIAKKYGTRYFMWTGNLSVKERDYMRGILIGYSVLFPPMLPFSLPRMIRGGKYQIYYYIVFDIITNEMVLGDVVTSNQLERSDFLNSQTYFTFHQLKYKR